MEKGSDGGLQDAAAVPLGNDIPEDLKFRGQDMKKWIQWNVDAATRDMSPPR